MTKEPSLCHVPELSLYNERAETKLYHYFEPQPGLFIAETPMVIRRALDAGYEPVSLLGEEKLLESQKELLKDLPEGLPVYAAKDEVLSEIAGYKLARGMLCAMRRKPPVPFNEIADKSSRLVVLDRVMNPTNVGAIIRSAAALGMDGILLTKGCADPLYRRAARVSLGNVFLLPWTFVDERIRTDQLIGTLKEKGFLTAAMALTEDAEFLGAEDYSFTEKLAVIMGSESEGVSKEILEVCDRKVMIPMAAGVDSLNVAAASAVAFWEFRKKTN